MTSLAVSEKSFQAAVVEAARLLGWRVHYVRHSIASPHGLPDLVPCNGDQLLFRELKTDKGRVTTEQSEWGSVLTRCGMDWAVWRPAEWPGIEATLRGQQSIEEAS